ncbi:TetR family transcriptional regulator [Xylanimonas cellulosilytica]|uniref:TetR/AcrR family transcriptional regulator n=1 Tax=Xylanimonas cellulosilytica TaxID=186189 RepID=UPI0002240CF2
MARGRVVTAADRLFYAHGVHAVGMDAVRAAAEVSLKRIYQLFPSKDDLVIGVLHHRTEQWTTGLEAAVGAATTPRGRLLAVFDYLDAWFREDDFRGCAFINSFGELGASSPAVADVVRTQKATFQAQLRERARAAGLPDAVGAQLAILAEGAQTTAAISGDPAAAGQARDAAELLIDAALARRV